MMMKQMTYEIHAGTMVLAPAKMIAYATKIIEEETAFYTEASAIQVINDACLKRWTTYEGRRNAVTKHTKMTRKVPIPICAAENITFFPTHAIDHFDNHWLALEHIMRVESLPEEKQLAKVIFNNGLAIDIPASSYIIEKQIERAFECSYRMKHGII